MPTASTISARRLMMISVVVAAAAFWAVMANFGPIAGAAAILTCFVVALIGVRTRRDIALAILSAAGGAAAVLAVIWWVTIIGGRISGMAPMLLLPVVAAAAPFLFNGRGTNPATTAWLAQIGCLLGAGVGQYTPALGFLVAIGWILITTTLRAGGLLAARTLIARARSGVPTHMAPLHALTDDDEERDDGWLNDRAEGELATALALVDLSDDWRVMRDRRVPGSTNTVEHLLVGPAGVIVVGTVDWPGTVDQSVIINEADPDMAERDPTAVTLDWTLDESAEALRRIVDTFAFEAATVIDLLGLAPHRARLVVSCTPRMKLPRPVISITLPVVDASGDTWAALPVDLCRTGYLRRHIDSLPPVEWPHPSRIDRWWSRLRKQDVEASTQRRHTIDVGAAADHLFPPTA